MTNKFTSKILLPFMALTSSINAKDNAKNQVVFTPQSILPAGVDETLSTNPYTGKSGKARKGTVAATLNNVAILNKLLLDNPNAVKDEKVESLSQAIHDLLPSLQAIGVFDLFSPKEWLSDLSQPGRILAALLYLEMYPENITSEVKSQLTIIKQETRIQTLLNKIENLLN